MARNAAYRRTVSDAVSWRQDQALNSTIYILRNMGPTGFLLKEDGETKNFKVYLGDPHRCTCQVYTKEKDLCKHICWVLLKKFRIPRQNPVTWQLGLVEREVNEILRGVAAKSEQGPSANARALARKSGIQISNETNDEESDGTIPQREISEEDVCPICQDELLAKHLPVTYCRHGCGNNVHIKCMKVWAEHQRSTGDTNIKCPFCRENFGPYHLLQQEFRNSSQTRAERFNEHLGIACKKCNTCPIIGKCYRCTTCTDYNLCQSCFNTPTHMEHSFEFKVKPNQRWRPAPQRGDTHILPQAVVQNLMNRDISEEDYDLLLQLDSQANQALSDLTEETIKSFPMERVRRNSTLLAPGTQCRVCLRAYTDGDCVRRLPCRHKFHKDCIDNWLLHHHPTCPIDGTTYTNESVRVMREAHRNSNTSQRLLQQRGEGNSADRTNRGSITQANSLTLEIPGIGIARRQSTDSSGNLPSGSRQRLTYGRGTLAQGTSDLRGLEIRALNGVEDSTEDVLAIITRHNNPEQQSHHPTGSFREFIHQSRLRSGRRVGSGSSGGDRSPNTAEQREALVTSSPETDMSRSDSTHNPRNGSVHEPHGADGPNFMIGNPSAEGLRTASAERVHSGSASRERHVDVMPREPVAPSIPQRGRGVDLGLTIDGPDVNSRKPPTRSAVELAGGRLGNRRNRPLYRDPGSRREDSAGRKRSNSGTRSNSHAPAGELFVGNDPSTTAGFISEYTTSATRVAGSRIRPSRRPGGDTRYRWGNTDNPSEDIVLSGNALTGMTLNDLIS